MEKLDARKRYTQMVLKQSFLKLLKEKPPISLRRCSPKRRIHSTIVPT